jgi:hypothetical protein
VRQALADSKELPARNNVEAARAQQELFASAGNSDQHGAKEAMLPSSRPRLFRAGLSAIPTMGRSSGFRIALLARPSRGNLPQWHFLAFVPGYSGGTATDLHRFPYSSASKDNLWPIPMSQCRF